MLADLRPRAATPLSDLSLAGALRQRHRRGRIAYLIALFTERRSKPTTTMQAPTARATTSAARTFPS